MTNQVDMIFWDVQHGNATYIKTPNERHIVIDLGLGDYSGKNQQFSPLVALRDRYNVRQLDHVIVTHPHRDHIDDILRFNDFAPKTFTTPRHITDAEIMDGVKLSDRPKFQEYCNIRQRYSLDVASGSESDLTSAQHYGGVQFTRFSTPHLPKANFNNHSILTVVEYAGTKVVIPGDNEFDSLEEMMQWTSFKEAVKNADILLAPHHGRESAYHNDFVNLVNPRLTIVSDGSICDTSANNRYSQKSRGWDVYYRKRKEFIKRNCLTTNSDGEIYVSFGPSTDPNYKAFLHVALE